jgi:hypothetical protein
MKKERSADFPRRSCPAAGPDLNPHLGYWIQGGSYMSLPTQTSHNQTGKAYPPNFAETYRDSPKKIFSANLGVFGASRSEFFLLFCIDFNLSNVETNHER